ncbi:hypothetical protein NQ317_007269 [Molorchus minor]|uniref:AB hydrolase-1 domain-containing protein n=1 Tax=Molorchus minor TaxID=1323400 RepID=A0ABQ9JJN5_9CUCU|nr:hypothetical protein NQ317_007269 [Molorchus minor]
MDIFYSWREHFLQLTKKTPIVIVHGIAMSGHGFVIGGTGGNESLVHSLGRLGYDVWILNYRGTWYSKKHTTLTPRDKKFWAFSIHELGIYDIRTALKYVNKATGQKPIYIGYSMGTTGFYVYSTTFSDEARSLVKGMIGLAPVINYKGVKSVAKFSALPVVWPILKSFVYLFWNGEILPGFSRFLKPFLLTSPGMYLIQTCVNLIFGDDYEQMNPITYPLLPTWIDTAGAEVYTHYVQIYQSGVFQNYDYGKNRNLEVYSQSSPPAYQISKVSVPVALFVGANDWLATPTNAQQLYSEIPESSRCGYNLVPFPRWNHIDFIVAKDLPKYLYKSIFHKIADIDDGKCKP